MLTHGITVEEKNSVRIAVLFDAHVEGMDSIQVVSAFRVGRRLVTREHGPGAPIHFVTEGRMSIVA